MEQLEISGIDIKEINKKMNIVISIAGKDYNIVLQLRTFRLLLKLFKVTSIHAICEQLPITIEGIIDDKTITLKHSKPARSKKTIFKYSN